MIETERKWVSTEFGLVETEIANLDLPDEPGMKYLWSQRSSDGWTHAYIREEALEALQSRGK
jgi:hypothetical protein